MAERSRFDKFRLGLSDFVGGKPRREEMRQMIDIMKEARRGSYVMTPDILMRNLREMDSRMVDLILRQYGYQLLGEQAFEYTEGDRLRAVDESRWMYRKSVLVKRAIQLWTDFGFGNAISIKPLDETADKDFQGFWTARRNAPLLKQRRLHMLSEKLLKDGEYFLIGFQSKVTGKTTLRRLGTKQVKRIIHEEDDKDVPLFYERNMDDGVWYYPDWSADSEMLDDAFSKIKAENKDAKRVDQMNDALSGVSNGTDVKALHVAYNIDENGRGWPQFASSYPWARTYESFISDIAGRARAIAMFVDEYIHKGGSRVQDDIEAKFQSTIPTYGYERNPMPPAGSPLVHNDQVTVGRRPFDSGAADAQKDKYAILSPFSADTGIPPHWLGNPDAMQNRSVAEETSIPFKQQAQRYQLFWDDIFNDLADIVLTGFELYGNASYTTKETEIGINAPVTINVEDLEKLMNAINTAIMTGELETQLGAFSVNHLAMVAVGMAGLRPSEIPESSAEETTESRKIMLKKLKRGEISHEQFSDFMIGDLMSRSVEFKDWSDAILEAQAESRE